MSVAVRAICLRNARMLPCAAEHGDERRRDRQPSGDLAEVECDVRADQVRSVRRDQAVLEDADPRALGHPPERALCEHVVRSGGQATARETAIDIGGEPLEVRVDCLRHHTSA